MNEPTLTQENYKETVNEFNKTLTDAKEVLNQKSLSASENKEKFEFIATANAKTLETLNKHEIELKSLKEAEDKVEKVLARPNFAAALKESGVEKSLLKSKEATSAFYKYISTDPQLQMPMVDTRHSKNNLVACLKSFNPRFESFSDTIKNECVFKAFQGHYEGSNEAGGFFLPQEISRMFIERAPVSNSFRPFSNQMSMSSASIEVPITDDKDAFAEWQSEIGPYALVNTRKIGLKTFTAKNLYVTVDSTIQLIQDAFLDFERWMAEQAVDQMDQIESSATLFGANNLDIEGILSLPAWSTPFVYERGALERVTSTASGSFVDTDIMNLTKNLKAPYRANSRFYMNVRTWTDVLILSKTTEGVFSLAPLTGYREGVGDVLMGFPVTLIDQMPNVAAGALPIILGDLKRGYTFFDRVGISVTRDVITQWPNIALKYLKRMAAGVTAYEAIKVFEILT